MLPIYIKRDMEKALKIAVKQFSAVMVTGPRQSGKTTLLKHLFSKSHRYVTMDDPDLRLMAIDDPALFFKNYRPPIIIDEVQNAPNIFPNIKMLIDNNRTAKGQFLLIGSQNFPLMAKVGESLAGRMAIFNLLPLSLREQLRQNIDINVETLKKKILTGGFPEVVTTKNLNIELWFSSYLQTYLERDVRQLRQIGDMGDFQKFLLLIAAFNGQIINLSNLSRDLGVAVNTLKAWLTILEASGQIISVKPFYLNKGKRIIKSPKVYFLDTGLLCYLTGITSEKQVFKGPLSGQLFETIVVEEIIKSIFNRGLLPRIFWWKTSHGEEVDFIIEDKGRIIPLEIKLAAKLNPQMSKNLLSFSKLFAEKIDKGFLINLSEKKLKIDEKITSIPFINFLQELD